MHNAPAAYRQARQHGLAHPPPNSSSGRAAIVQTEGYDGELSPAQWMALRFFARANSFSRTPSA
jgi:hypothetical protein